jgi:hypothetical protein
MNFAITESLFSFVAQLFEILPDYVNTLRDFSVPAPLFVLLTLKGVNRVAYAVSDKCFADSEPSIEGPLVFL